jgi:1-acyl-sn-glycerol-3-phosphate acyltransferase
VVKEKGNLAVAVLASVFYPVTWLFSRRTAKGLGNVPRRGPALVVLNHPSYIDPIIDAIYVHELGRVPRFFAKHTLWNIPLLGKVLDGAGQVPVYRNSSKAGDSLRGADAALRDGGIVMIYPEGTLTADPDGWPGKGRTGVARIALANPDVPVIPAAKWGTKDILDSRNRRFRPFPPKRVHMVVGEPVDLSAYRDREVTRELLYEVTEVVMAQVRELLKEIRS